MGAMRRTCLLGLSLLVACAGACSSSSNDRGPSSSGRSSDRSGRTASSGDGEEGARRQPEGRVAPRPAPTPPPAPTAATADRMTGPVIRIETSMGTVRVQLDQSRAPNTVANFMRYVDESFYDGLVFHRIIDDFMIQGGGFTQAYTQKPTREPIRLEIHPELRHVDGAIAMARTNDPNSATAQFYICDGPVHRLDDAYAPFGVVIEGIEVVRQIAAVETQPGDRPVTPVVIETIRRD